MSIAGFSRAGIGNVRVPGGSLGSRADPVRPTFSSSFEDRDRLAGRAGVCVAFGADDGRVVLGNEVDGELGSDFVECEDEVQVVNSLPSPYMPSQSERDDHELTHARYRSWSEHCVDGRGVEMGHRMGDDHSERGVALVAFDYMFQTSSGLYSRKDWMECDEKDIDLKLVLKILVVRDMKSKSIFAHAVRCKGIDEDGYAVQ